MELNLPALDRDTCSYEQSDCDSPSKSPPITTPKCARLPAATIITRSVFVAAAVLLIVCQSGCRWTNGIKAFTPFQPQGDPVFQHNTSKVEIIDRLNANTSRIRSWRSENTVIKVKGPGSPIPVSLKAVIAVEAPRNFRMRAQSTLANADMGSNDERLWFWVQPGCDNVMTASHEDVPMIQRHANLPFDPAWLMEVLGVVPLERQSVELHSATDPRGRYSSLVFDRVAPDGKQYQRIVTIDNNYGTISEHRLIDQDNNVTVAIGTLKNYQMINRANVAHNITLEWPLTKTKFEMRLKDIQVNVPIDEAQWSVPKMDNYPSVDLGEQVAMQLGLNRQPVSQRVLEAPPFETMERESLDSVRQRLRSSQTAEAPPWDGPGLGGDNPFE